MTSPAIQSNEKARKAAETAKQRKQSETSSANGATSSSAQSSTTVANTLPSNGLFTWLRIFRFADSLMRQGC